MGQPSTREAVGSPSETGKPILCVGAQGISDRAEYSAFQSQFPVEVGPDLLVCPQPWGSSNSQECGLPTSGGDAVPDVEGALSDYNPFIVVSNEGGSDKIESPEVCEDQVDRGQTNPTVSGPGVGDQLESEQALPEVTVCLVNSATQFSTEVQVGNRIVEAVVDTGAEFSIISDRVYRSLRKPPNRIRDVRLLTAGRELYMNAFVAGPIMIKIGSQWYEEHVYVAPIEVEMLLGFDILYERGKAVLDMGRGKLVFDGQEIDLKVQGRSESPQVARVTVDRRRVVPPNSVVQIKCSMGSGLSDASLSDYVIEPVDNLEVLVPRVLRQGGDAPIVCVVNASDKFQLLRKGTQMATASPVHSYCDISQEEIKVHAVHKDSHSPGGLDSEIPGHLREMWVNSCQHLVDEQQTQLADLLREYEDVFARDEFDLGNFTHIEHSIDTDGAKAVKQGIRRTPACYADEEEAHLKKMLEAGVIQESTSEWASAPVLIRKRDGSVRWCIDYRALNEVTRKDVFPLPLVDDCLDTLAGSVWFSKLDANSAYWQIKVREEDRRKTAFITKYGLFEHVRMGFGLCNAPATYSRVMNLVLRGLNWKIALAFLDDILVLGSNFGHHLTNLASTLSRFREYGLKLKPKKCTLFQKEVDFLGRRVGSNSLAMTDQDIQVVRDWPTPSCSKDVERFLGLANYHRSFIRKFAELADPLYRITRKQPFEWAAEQNNAFLALKNALVRPPVLALPNLQDEFVLDTDASHVAIGAELLQVQNGQEVAISYGSYALSPEQRRYCVTRKELLAVVRFTRQYRHYLLGRPFTVRTDHSSLIWLMHFKAPQGQLARWMEELSQFNMVLKYRPGLKHGNADALSRIPVEELCSEYTHGMRLEDLPCGGCTYCRRVDKNWGDFIREVDPLEVGGSNQLNGGRLKVAGTQAGDARFLTAGSSGGGPGRILEHGSGLRPCESDESLGGTRCEPSHGVSSGWPGGFTSLEGVSMRQADQASPGDIMFRDNPLESCRDQVTGETGIMSGSRLCEHRPDGSCALQSKARERSVGHLSEWSCDEQLLSTRSNHTGQSENGSGRLPDMEAGEVILPWEEGGCCEECIHIDLVTRAGETVIVEGDGSVRVLSHATDAPSCWGFSTQDVVDAQAQDGDLQLVLAWLHTSEVPEKGVLFLASPAAKSK
ncbi:MAG: pol polyprotein [Sedimenticola sp.]